MRFSRCGRKGLSLINRKTGVKLRGFSENFSDFLLCRPNGGFDAVVCGALETCDFCDASTICQHQKRLLLHGAQMSDAIVQSLMLFRFDDLVVRGLVRNELSAPAIFRIERERRMIPAALVACVLPAAGFAEKSRDFSSDFDLHDFSRCKFVTDNMMIHLVTSKSASVSDAGHLKLQKIAGQQPAEGFSYESLSTSCCPAIWCTFHTLPCGNGPLLGANSPYSGCSAPDCIFRIASHT